MAFQIQYIQIPYPCHHSGPIDTLTNWNCDLRWFDPRRKSEWHLQSLSSHSCWSPSKPLSSFSFAQDTVSGRKYLTMLFTSFYVRSDFCQASALASPWRTNCPRIPVQRAFGWDRHAIREAERHGALVFPQKSPEMDEALHLRDFYIQY